MQKSTIVYALAALMLLTAVIYFVAAAEESTEGSEDEQAERNIDNDERVNAEEDEENEGDGVATQVQTAFFTVTGLAYAAVGGWILKDRGKTKAPYVIAMAGSLAIIGLYVASRTVALPVVGLQDDVGTIDILSKILQGGVIALAAYSINFKVPAKMTTR